MKLTDHQRIILERRVARALCWADTENLKRDRFNYLATVVVRELAEGGHTASAQRRAVVNLVDRIEETA